MKKEIKEEIKPFLEANKNLSQKITKLEKENQELFWFKEKYQDSLWTIKKLEKRLKEKNQIKIVGKKLNEDIFYNLQIIKLEHTLKGIFVEVLIN